MNDTLPIDEPVRADAPAGRIIPSDPDALLFESEAAYLLGMERRTLADWRLRGDGPPFHRLGRVRAVRYRRRELVAWVDSRRRRSTSDLGSAA